MRMKLWTATRSVVFVSTLVAMSAIYANADILRWDDHQVIPGTEGIVVGPGILLDERTLAYAELSGANLSEGYLALSDLSHAHMNGVNLAFAILSRANLSDATLVGANLKYAGMDLATLANADLTGAELEGAYLDAVTSSGRSNCR